MKSKLRLLTCIVCSLFLWQQISAKESGAESFSFSKTDTLRRNSLKDPFGTWQKFPSKLKSKKSSFSEVGTLISPEACEQLTLATADIEEGFSNFGLIQMANDLVVPANKDFSLEKISFNTMVEMGKPVNSVDLYFYKDSGNGPGKLISSQLGVVPSSTKNLGVFKSLFKN